MIPVIPAEVGKKYPQAQERLACGNEHGWIVQFLWVFFHNGAFACHYVLCVQTSGKGTITEGP